MRTFPNCINCGFSSIDETFVAPFRGQRYRWMQCSQCRLLWVDPQPEPASIRDQSDEPFFTTETFYVGNTRHRRSVARRRLAVLSRLVDPLAGRHGLRAVPGPPSWLAFCDVVFRDLRTFYFKMDPGISGGVTDAPLLDRVGVLNGHGRTPERSFRWEDRANPPS